jgi:hypothetical protein
METSRQLTARFERGEIDRTKFQSLMAIHARELIAEIEEDHLNPLAAWVESRLAEIRGETAPAETHGLPHPRDTHRAL